MGTHALTLFAGGLKGRRLRTTNAVEKRHFTSFARSRGAIFYNSTEHLLHLLEWALQHSRQADAIAQHGAEAAHTTVDMVDHMMRVVQRASVSLRTPVRLFIYPIKPRYQENEFLLTLDGLNRSGSVALQANVSNADVILLDLWRLYNYCGKYFVPAVRRCFESGVILPILDKYARSHVIIATDWSDPATLALSPRLLGNTTLIHHLFKRSQVFRSGDGRSARRMQYGREVHPLWYPITPDAKVRLVAQTQLRPRRTRPVDISYFFGSYEDFDARAGSSNTSCKHATRSQPGSSTVASVAAGRSVTYTA